MPIPADWQGMGKLPTPRGGIQQLKLISEPAVYKLAFRSNKPEADEFTNWVASDVLPAIRKTGKYDTVDDGSQPQAPPRPYCTDREMKPLGAAVDAWVKASKLTRLEALAKLRTQFGITRYNRFWPVELIEPAIAWIHAQSGTLKALPNTKRLFDDIRKAEHALKPVEHWTHIAVRGELGRATDSIARQAVDMHVNAAWYALGLARSALLSALAVGKMA